MPARVLAYVRGACIAAAASLALAACQSTDQREDATSSSTIAGAEAPLRPVGNNTGAGSVRFVARKDGVSMLVFLSGVPAGQYRVAIHAMGNCTSPNGFSAGPVWSIPGVGPQVLVVSTNTEGTATVTRRIAGVRLDGPDGLMGHSVVLHDRSVGPLDAEPGKRNDRLACGVIEPVRTIF